MTNIQDARRAVCAVRANGRGPRLIWLGAALVGLSIVPSSVRAQSASGEGASAPTLPTRSSPGDTLRLTLAVARALALRSNPELRATRLGIDIARGELRQAGLLLQSNPSADVLAGGPGAEIGLTQEIEIAGQRGARQAAGRAGVERAQASVLNAARLTVADADRAFYRLAASRQREALATEILVLNARLTNVSTRQLIAGDISQLEANLATVEYGRSRARALGARRERTSAEAELRRLLGLPITTPIAPRIDLQIILPPVVPSGVNTPSASVQSSALLDSLSVARSLDSLFVDTLAVDSLTTLALARRPDLVERAAAARQALGQASVARREAFPNLALRASSEQLEGGEGRALRPGIGITLPVFNRNQGEVEARRAEARQAQLERAALVVGVRSDVATAVTTYETAAAETSVLERTVLAPARENRRLLEIAYRAGKVGLPELLLIRNQVMDAELEYWEAWLAAHEALADLDAATGRNVATSATALPR